MLKQTAYNSSLGGVFTRYYIIHGIVNVYLVKVAIYKLLTLKVRKHVIITVLEILYIYFYTHGYQSVSCTSESGGYKLFWHRNENTFGWKGHNNKILLLGSFQHQHWMRGGFFICQDTQHKSFNLSNSGIIMASVLKRF